MPITSTNGISPVTGGYPTGDIPKKQRATAPEAKKRNNESKE